MILVAARLCCIGSELQVDAKRAIALVEIPGAKIVLFLPPVSQELFRGPPAYARGVPA
jgi:hypothetical protein